MGRPKRETLKAGSGVPGSSQLCLQDRRARGPRGRKGRSVVGGHAAVSRRPRDGKHLTRAECIPIELQKSARQKSRPMLM